ncbi:MAG: bifunctional non-ous end joining protein LigD, partial [Actinomycetota bacterium]|nr:bifunctional non-ous end joining protein LigD [Actinomycetota bacterium]
MARKSETYREKRSFDITPEPEPAVDGNVDPTKARAGKSFLIHQHHARRLHFDLRLEMFNGDVPVLVSWAIPNNLPLHKDRRHLAVHVEDHPFEYGSFSGTIPAGQYGAGEVRIFDHGTYEVLEQETAKLTIRLLGERMKGVWHLVQTSRNEDGPDEWLAMLRKDERPEPEALPPLAPMMATLVRDPFDKDGWIFEPKWDGVRTLATCGIEETLLLSRNAKDMTATYPEMARLHERIVAIDAVVDGEIVAMEGGRPSFEKLQSRINLQNPRDIERAMTKIPITFIAFDVLYVDGRSLINEPIETRKEILEEIVVVSDRVQVSPYIERDGVSLFEAAEARNLEGIVAKKLGCPYRPGRRGREWLKVKAIQDADVVVGGWTKGEGSRSTTFGALLVGAYEADGSLRFIGSVGTGFTEKTLGELLPQLQELTTDGCPFAVDPRKMPSGSFGKPVRDPRWVRPELVAVVEFRELTSAGRLRAPSFKGLRTDKDPDACLFED